MNSFIPKLAQVATLALVTFASATLAAANADKPIDVNDKSFNCISSMRPVRGFYVDNLKGNIKQTLAAARAKDGGTYPPGSVVQLVPTEVMVKQPPGTSPATKDWEFFELDVSPQGSKIAKRGFTDVVNRFGGNCFACHSQARPEWDMVCETGHGCQPIPLTRAMTLAIQRSDPRCTPAKKLSQEDLNALAELDEMLKKMAK